MIKALKDVRKITDLYGMRAEAVDEEGVREALMPELELIKDPDLREKAVKAWALACRMGGYERLEDIPTERFEWLPDLSNIQHQKDTARIASAITRALRELGVELDEDHVVTGALCHDLGKPVEWRNNQSGVFSTRTGAGVFYGENPNMPPPRGGCLISGRAPPDVESIHRDGRRHARAHSSHRGIPLQRGRTPPQKP